MVEPAAPYTEFDFGVLTVGPPAATLCFSRDPDADAFVPLARFKFVGPQAAPEVTEALG